MCKGMTFRYYVTGPGGHKTFKKKSTAIAEYNKRKPRGGKGVYLFDHTKSVKGRLIREKHSR